MKAIKFKEHNVVLAENQPQYTPLPVLRDQGTEGIVVSCYKMSFKDKLRAVFIGKIWIGQMTFHNPLQPQLISTKKKDLILPKRNKIIWNIQRLLFEKSLPIYIPAKNAYVGGWCLAIWNCGTRPQSFLQAFKDTRITIRKNGEARFVIKKGDIKK